MRATLIKHIKAIDDLGNTIEIKIWQLPKLSNDRSHGYKYSLVYIVDGIRIIGYDNAEGKRDHRHYMNSEAAYKFIDLNTLLLDFEEDINKYKEIKIHEDKKNTDKH